MRIIGGDLAGHVLKPPMSKWPTRPTTDRAREALFNILMNRVDFTNTSFLDLFGGTGAHSIEFLSRGCTDVTYVDRFGKCVSWIKTISSQLGIDEYLHIYAMDVAKFIKKNERSYKIIFADPPYALKWINTIPDLIFEHSLLELNGLLIIEHGSDVSFKNHLRFNEERRYGQSSFSFFK